jgi:mannose-6-phosphate isomerase-like protein (cupin superfamily)
MDELDKGLSISLSPNESRSYLQAFQDQMQDWDMVMPPVEPLVLDFGLGDFNLTGLIEYWIANEVEAGYCGKYLFVFDGQTCPLHHHLEKLETFFIVKGSVKMEYAGDIRILHAGDVLRMDVGSAHSFTGLGPALLLEVSRPCLVDDNYFANRSIPIGGNYEGVK